MSVRLRRLQAEHEKLKRLFEGHDRISIVETAGDPPDRYTLEYRIKGLVQENDEIHVREVHRARIILGPNFPKEMPQCVMLTSVFHPNIDHLAICTEDIGSAGQTVDQLITFIGEMISYQAYNVQSPRNGEAAQWAREHVAEFPLENVNLTPTILHEGPSVVPVFPETEKSVPAELCANCGASSAAAALKRCFGGHLACPECVLECANCRKPLCVLCNLSSCAACRRVACEDCGVACAGCGRSFCLEHSGTCFVCGRYECADCAKTCAARRYPAEATEVDAIPENVPPAPVQMKSESEPQQFPATPEPVLESVPQDPSYLEPKPSPEAIPPEPIYPEPLPAPAHMDSESLLTFFVVTPEPATEAMPREPTYPEPEPPSGNVDSESLVSYFPATPELVLEAIPPEPIDPEPEQSSEAASPESTYAEPAPPPVRVDSESLESYSPAMRFAAMPEPAAKPTPPELIGPEPEPPAARADPEPLTSHSATMPEPASGAILPEPEPWHAAPTPEPTAEVIPSEPVLATPLPPQASAEREPETNQRALTPVPLQVVQAGDADVTTTQEQGIAQIVGGNCVDPAPVTQVSRQIPILLTGDEVASVPESALVRPPRHVHIEPEVRSRPSGKAIAALVFGIVGAPVMGILLGWFAILFAGLAKRDMNANPGLTGRSLATIALVLGVFDILLWAGIIALYGPVALRHPAPLMQPRTKNLVTLLVAGPSFEAMT